MVFALLERLANGQLNPVMTGIGPMVRPANGLLQIIGRLLIYGPAHRHQPVPVRKRLLGGLLDRINLGYFCIFHCVNFSCFPIRKFLLVGLFHA